MEVKPGYKQTEIGFIPEDWDIRALGRICDVRDGTHESPRFFSEGVPLVTSKNIVNGYLDLENVNYISKTAAIEFNKRSKVDRNDILLSMIGTIGSAVLVECEPDFCIKNVALLKTRGIDSSFLIQLISSPIFQQYLRDNLDGGIQKFISLGTLRALSIALPEEPEQHAIADALSDVDALLDSLDRLIAKKRDLKQAAMQQLLTGQKRLPGFSGEWEVKRLGDVAILKNGYAFKSNTYSNLGALNVITIANVQDGFMDIESCNKISSEPSDLQPHQRLSRGDILISMTGNVGRVCRVDADNCLLNQRVGKLVPIYLSEIFLFFLLRQPSFTSAMADVAKGGAQPNLSALDITNHPLLIPNELSEQTAICEVLTVLNEEVEMLEKRRKKTAALKEGMMQELLTGRTRLV